MRRLLTVLVLALPLLLSACSSYGIHLYSDPQLLQVIDERLVLSEAETVGDPLAVLMRGDSVVVIGERRNNWEYELDMHDRHFIVYYSGRQAYVPYRALITRAQYATMYGTPQPSTTAASTTTAATAATTQGATGGVAVRDTVATPPPDNGDLTGGRPTGGRRGDRN